MPTARALRLAAFHGAVALAALAASPSASLAALSVSALALLRYGAMSAFASAVGRESGARTALLGGAWLLAFLALAPALAAVARLDRASLLWAAAAALAGPAALAAESCVAGIRGAADARRRAA